METIPHLPPELLTKILSNETLSLQQRITLRAVSKYWLAVLEENVLTQLTLGDSEHCLPFTAQSIPHLIRIFPLLADLTVTMEFSSPYEQLSQFLTNFSSTLKTLKLWNINRAQPENTIWLEEFTRAINSLVELTSFTLNFENDVNISAILPQLRPTLTRLQQFNYTVKSGSEQSHPIWQSFINTPLIRMINLEIGQLNTADYAATVADIVATFPSLQRLSLSANAENQTIRLTEMLRHLSSLEHLTELYLSAPSQTATPPSLPSETDRRLLPVKALTWSIKLHPVSISERNHPCAALAAWFPSLEQLSLDESKRHFDLTLQITSHMLRGLSSLEHLTELSLSRVDCDSRLVNPEPTDRLLTNLKKLKVLFHYPFNDGNIRDAGIILRLTAWFPNLQSLTVDFLNDDRFSDDYNPLFKLTVSLLQNLSRLESLTSLQLPKMLCKREHLDDPLPTDRPLTCLKKLSLKVDGFSTELDGEHLISALAAWCPRLEKLSLPLQPTNSSHFYLTSSMLRDFANLKYLQELSLPTMLYKRKHLEVPLPADQQLTCLKKLRLNAYGFSTELDGEHFISALVAFCPGLEELSLSSQHDQPFYLTTNLVRDLASLKYLKKLNLPRMLYKRKHLEVPLPTDQPLIVLKDLSLDITDSAEEFNGEQCFSAIAGWFPRLEMLFFGEYQPKFYLTSNMLRTLGRLEHLNNLDLSPFFYSKQHLDVPLSTDRPLMHVENFFYLPITESPAEFNGKHFCSIITKWFPCLQRLALHINSKYDENVESYRRSIVENRPYRSRSDGFFDFRFSISSWPDN